MWMYHVIIYSISVDPCAIMFPSWPQPPFGYPPNNYPGDGTMWNSTAPALPAPGIVHTVQGCDPQYHFPPPTIVHPCWPCRDASPYVLTRSFPVPILPHSVQFCLSTWHRTTQHSTVTSHPYFHLPHITMDLHPIGPIHLTRCTRQSWKNWQSWKSNPPRDKLLWLLFEIGPRGTDPCG